MWYLVDGKNSIPDNICFSDITLFGTGDLVKSRYTMWVQLLAGCLIEEIALPVEHQNLPCQTKPYHVVHILVILKFLSIDTKSNTIHRFS